MQTGLPGSAIATPDVDAWSRTRPIGYRCNRAPGSRTMDRYRSALRLVIATPDRSDGVLRAPTSSRSSVGDSDFHASLMVLRDGFYESAVVPLRVSRHVKRSLSTCRSGNDTVPRPQRRARDLRRRPSRSLPRTFERPLLAALDWCLTLLKSSHVMQTIVRA